MFRSYLNAALRNLVRNKFYAALNISGLALGFAAALLIALFIRDEFSYDRWLPGADKVQMIVEKLAIPNQKALTDDIVPEELKATLLTDYPGIERIARLEYGVPSVRHGDIETAEEPVYWADPEFFKVIKLEALAGDLDTALAQPNSVVITRKIAQKYFGKDAPIGEILEFNRNMSMTVTAVLKDLPSNTQFNTDIIGSALTNNSSGIYFKDTRPPGPNAGWGVGSYMYMTLKPGATVADIAPTLPDFIAKHKAASIPFTGKAPLRIMRMTDVHFQNDVRGGFFYTLNPQGSLDTIFAVGAVGLLILAIAAINFVNLTTARATRRAVEVGLRKAVGADPAHLIVQFVGESLVYVTLGMLIAMAMTALVLPAFNAYLTRTIRFDFWADPLLAAGIVATVLIVGVLAGAYPAFVLSGFRPKTVLKSGTIQSSASALLRSALVVFQFAVLIGLILMTFVIYRQTDYAINRGTHMDVARVHVVAGNCSLGLQNAIRALPGVESAACSQGQILNRGKNGAGLELKDGTQITVDIAPVDFGLLELYGIQPSAGRLFMKDRPGEQPPALPPPPQGAGEAPPPPQPFTWPLVVNETLAAKIGAKGPASAVGEVVGTFLGPKGQSEIIGVVPDFALETHQPVPPTIYFLVRAGGAGVGFLSVKLRAGQEQSALDAIDAVWNRMVPGRPIRRYSMEQYLTRLNADTIRQAQIFGAFALIAVFIAGLGLFGLSAFTSERRTKEIGVRKALGADRAPIVGLLMWQFTKPVLWANLIAWPVSYYMIRRWLDGFPYHIQIELWFFVAASLIALVIAWITISGYSYRVAGAKPSQALRYE